MKFLTSLLLTFFLIGLFSLILQNNLHAAPCSFSVSVNTTTPGGLIRVEVFSSPTFFLSHTYSAFFRNTDGSIVPGSDSQSEPILPGENSVEIRLTAPSNPQDYLVLVTDTNDGNSCTPTGNNTITVQASGGGGDGAPGGIDFSLPSLPTSPTSGTGTGFTAQNLIVRFITRTLPIILGLAGFITVIFIVVSGIQFILSSGNPEAAAAARGRLTMAIVGFAVIVLAFALTQIVDKIFLGGSGVV